MVLLSYGTTVSDWQGELKDGALGRGRRRPKSSAVGLDDGTADRKSHAHASGLGCKEGLKDALGVHRIESRSVVRDHDEGFTRFRDLPSDLQHLRAIRDRTHSFQSIHD